MRQLNEKVILTDCDGVLLDWEYHFYKWLKATEGLEKLHDFYNIAKATGIDHDVGAALVAKFNTSRYMLSLSPLRDAIKYVRKLHEEHGYIFHVITSQTDDINGQQYRKSNLKNVFGDVFDGFTILGCGDDKIDALKEWEGTECWWIEDKVANIEMGNQVGLRGILINHTWNKNTNYKCDRADKWKDVYNIITGDV